jgi:hypothetical protein
VTRRLAALLLAGLALSACGSQSPATALRSWVTQSAFASAVTTLRTDASHAQTTLGDPATAPNVLHTVCGVLNFDAQAANSSLPTPDTQATTLLGRAYGEFGAGTALCYGAAHDTAKRTRAENDLHRAVATLAEARARITAAS